MRLVGVLAERQHRGMLEEEQPVADLAIGSGSRQAFLEVPRLPIRNATEPALLDSLDGNVIVERRNERGGLHRRTIAVGPRSAICRQTKKR